MKKLVPSLSSIFSEIKSLMDPEKLNNHPYFKNSSPQDFTVLVELMLDAFARDILEIDDIDFDCPPLKDEHFRKGWIKNWVRRYFGNN